MGWKEAAEPVLTRMPSVQRPDGHVPFKRKLGWTGGILVLYFFLTTITVYGTQPVGTGGGDAFGQFRSILAGANRSILHLGIGPIVTASIVLQLLGGANLLGLDTDDPRDQILYQGLQKVLVLVMTVLTAVPMVFLSSGILPIAPGAQETLAGFVGVGNGSMATRWLIFAQIFIGGVLILFMDEIVSKWGVGSGIGLFIIAGVSQRLVTGFIAVFRDWFGIVTGSTGVNVFTQAGFQDLLFNQGHIIALITTLLIFAIVVYAESVRVEIPLSHARVKGARGRFPVKLIYASVLPMILVRALQANIQFLGRGLSSLGSAPAWLVEYNGSGQAIGGLFYYLAPVQRPSDWIWWGDQTGTAATVAAQEGVIHVILRVGVDLTFMIAGGAIFAIFWVETTDMGPKSTAKQIQNSGMQIPGFRQNVGVIEKVMERYIPQVTVIGGALVGLLAVMANMLGTVGSVTGTGLLLTVSITYKLYEEIAEEQLMEMHPMMRQMFGN
ncbi:preprotein translocase subunit SecY [Haloarchaeobius iranensis]|uniref:Protein translocase subunit SecY n=1 Tax=Haloarchaeobius iranensis TaxID=996166 RepID=A0A1H0ADD3_9EURY|nr:preprotein translocase subunit SecY [Haloarchaeobius iranensis]SDN31417.1 protein translocase subunit secY/sec61 alpha [Haloarchaeobius iranensis]